MGMDSMAVAQRGEPTIDGEGGWIYLDEIALGYWRNHRRLHSVIEDIHAERTGERDINTKAIELDLAAFTRLEMALNDGDLSSDGDGLEEHCYMQEFIAAGRKALVDGYTVRYWCWY